MMRSAGLLSGPPSTNAFPAGIGAAVGLVWGDRVMAGMFHHGAFHINTFLLSISIPLSA
jgi:hypothetical protein